MTTPATPIVEDFAAIAARLAELRLAAERAAAAAPQTAPMTEEQRQLAAYYAQCPT